MTQSIEVKGLARLEKKLTPALYRAEVTSILTKGALAGESLSKVDAPVQTGRLRASITHKVGPGNPPAYSKYGTNVPYGRYLDQPVSRRPHYRRGPKRGAPTKGWMTDTLPRVKAAVNGFVRDAAASIAKRWGS